MLFSFYRIKLLAVFLFLTNAVTDFVFSQIIDEKTDFRVKQPLLFEQQKDIMDRLRSREEIFKFEVPEFKIEKKEDDKCVNVKAISVRGYSKVSRREIFEIVSKYSDKCVGKTAITNLLNEINNLYIKNGYITSRAYLNPNALREGTLDIHIVEGKIEDITGNAEGIKTAFFGLKGKVLNIRDIEIGVERLNRLYSNNVSVNLEPGTSHGYTKVVVLNKPRRPYMFNISLNNFGYKETGQYRISSTIRLENLLRISDIFSLNINTTNRQDPNKRSITNSVSYSFPLHRLLFSFYFSNMTYAQSLKGLIANYSMLTTNNNLSVDMEYKITHSQSFKLSSGINLSLRENTTLVEEIKMETSSYKYNKGSIFIKSIFFPNKLYLSLTLNLHKGLGGDEKFVVDVYRNNEVYKISGYFTKYSLEGNLLYSLPFGINLVSLFYGQYSDQRLYSAEQISVGGPFSVRGFFEDTLSGDTGFYIRNDIERSFIFGGKLLVKPSLGIDYGIVDCTRDSYCGAIAGASAGLDLIYGSLSLNVFHAITLYYPEYFKDRNFTGMMININL